MWLISLSPRALTGRFYNFLQDLHENSRLALKFLGLGLKLLSPIQEFDQFGSKDRRCSMIAFRISLGGRLPGNASAI
jgi:hypothetical protein